MKKKDFKSILDMPAGEMPEFALLPIGLYTAFIVGVPTEEESKNEKAFINVQCELVEPFEVEDEDALAEYMGENEVAGRKMNWRIFYENKTGATRLQSLIDCCDLGHLASKRKAFEEMAGKTIIVNLKHNLYNDVMSEQIDGCMKYEG
jgi:hypothetical protein